MPIAKNIFSDTELRMFENAENPYNIFYSLWCLKESYVKYTGTGISFSLKNISFVLDEKITLIDSSKPAKYCNDLLFYLMAIRENYKLVVCTKDSELLLKTL